jgi:hypothetical protein
MISATMPQTSSNMNPATGNVMAKQVYQALENSESTGKLSIASAVCNNAI